MAPVLLFQSSATTTTPVPSILALMKEDLLCATSPPSHALTLILAMSESALLEVNALPLHTAAMMVTCVPTIPAQSKDPTLFVSTPTIPVMTEMFVLMIFAKLELVALAQFTSVKILTCAMTMFAKPELVVLLHQSTALKLSEFLMELSASPPLVMLLLDVFLLTRLVPPMTETLIATKLFAMKTQISANSTEEIPFLAPLTLPNKVL